MESHKPLFFIMCASVLPRCWPRFVASFGLPPVCHYVSPMFLCILLCFVFCGCLSVCLCFCALLSRLRLHAAVCGASDDASCLCVKFTFCCALCHVCVLPCSVILCSVVSFVSSVYLCFTIFLSSVCRCDFRCVRLVVAACVLPSRYRVARVCVLLYCLVLCLCLFVLFLGVSLSCVLFYGLTFVSKTVCRVPFFTAFVMLHLCFAGFPSFVFVCC